MEFHYSAAGSIKAWPSLWGARLFVLANSSALYIQTPAGLQHVANTFNQFCLVLGWCIQYYKNVIPEPAHCYPPPPPSNIQKKQLAGPASETILFS